MTDTTRIESLETQVRTLKRMLFGVFGLVMLGGLLAAANYQGVPDVIQAKKFEVVTSEGHAVVQLSANKTGGLVAVENGEGQRLVQLKGHPEGGTVTIHNSQGKTLVLIGGNNHGSGAFQTRNSKGQTLVALGTNPAGEGTVLTENGKGEKTSSMP